MSGRETTASEPRLRGCSGSEIVEIRSNIDGHIVNKWHEDESKKKEQKPDEKSMQIRVVA